MSVVVNEFDVVPAAPASEPTPTPAAPPEPPARLTPAPMADVDRTMRVRAERQPPPGGVLMADARFRPARPTINMGGRDSDCADRAPGPAASARGSSRAIQLRGDLRELGRGRRWPGLPLLRPRPARLRQRTRRCPGSDYAVRGPDNRPRSGVPRRCAAGADRAGRRSIPGPPYDAAEPDVQPAE